MSPRRSPLGMDPLGWITDSREKPALPRVSPGKAGEGPARVLEIVDTPLSQHIADFFLCRNCGTVGREGVEKSDHLVCPTCQLAITEAPYYFKRPVHTLIDMMQETYHRKDGRPAEQGETEALPRFDHQISVVIFFAYLAETTLDHFFRELMQVLRTPDRIIDRLLVNHRHPRERGESLFPTVTGDRWSRTIEELSAQRGLNYVDTVRLNGDVLQARDAFLYKGDTRALGSEMPRVCMQQIWPLLNLCVDLHNRYVPGIYMNWKRKSGKGEGVRSG